MVLHMSLCFIPSTQSLLYTYRKPTIHDRVNRYNSWLFRGYERRRAFITKTKTIILFTTGLQSSWLWGNNYLAFLLPNPAMKRRLSQRLKVRGIAQRSKESTETKMEMTSFASEGGREELVSRDNTRET